MVHWNDLLSIWHMNEMTAEDEVEKKNSKARKLYADRLRVYAEGDMILLEGFNGFSHRQQHNKCFDVGTFFSIK